MLARLLKTINDLPSISGNDEFVAREWLRLLNDWTILLGIKEVAKKGMSATVEEDIVSAKTIANDESRNFANATTGQIQRVQQGQETVESKRIREKREAVVLKRIQQEREKNQLLGLAIRIEAAKKGVSLPDAFQRVELVDSLMDCVKAYESKIRQERKKGSADENVSADEIVAKMDSEMSVPKNSLLTLYMKLSLLIEVMETIDPQRTGVEAVWKQEQRYLTDMLTLVTRKIIDEIEKEVQESVNRELKDIPDIEKAANAELAKLLGNDPKLIASRRRQEMVDERKRLFEIFKNNLMKEDKSLTEKNAKDQTEDFFRDVRKQVVADSKDSPKTDEEISLEIMKRLYVATKEEEDHLKRYIAYRKEIRTKEFFVEPDKKAALVKAKMKDLSQRPNPKIPMLSTAVAQLSTVNQRSSLVQNRYAKLAAPKTLENIVRTSREDKNHYARVISKELQKDSRINAVYQSGEQGLPDRKDPDKFAYGFHKNKALKSAVAKNYNLALAIDKYKAQKEMSAVLEDKQQSKSQKYTALLHKVNKHKDTLELHRKTPSRFWRRVAFAVGHLVGWLGVFWKPMKSRLWDSQTRGARAVQNIEKAFELPTKKRTEEDEIRASLKDARRRGLR